MKSKKDLKIIIPKVDIDSLYDLFFIFRKIHSVYVIKCN